jgi:tRNA dimethylallyltransferase
LEEPDKHLIVIVGPTAVGKTAVAIRLAQFLGTEIISADSRQIFKELNIGTAKPSEADLSLVEHHFINTKSIQDDYDAAAYGRDALQRISALFKEYDKVVLCGGSGLYIKAVCDGFDDIPEITKGVREELTQKYDRLGLEWLQSEMKLLDPDYFNEIDSKNPHRMIRALEVVICTGSSITSFQSKRKIKHPFSIIKIGLEIPREELYRSIDDRMDKMIHNGLFEEAEKLYPQRHRQALQTVGYKEIFDFMDGKYDQQEAVRLLKRNSRRYAKRQLTWFKRDLETHWFSPADFDKIIELVTLEKNRDA